MRMLPRWLGLLLLLFSSMAVAEGDRLMVVLSRDGAGYDRIATMLQHYAQEKHRDVQIIKETDLPLIKSPGKVVWLPIGSLATQAVLKRFPQQPILSVMLTRSAYETLRAEGARFSAILLDQPPRRVLNLAAKLLPDASQYGLLAGAETDSVAPRYLQAAKKIPLNVRVAHVEEDQKTAMAINVLLEDSQAVIVLPDAVVMTPTTAKWLLYMAYQQNIPVIGFSQAYVKAGALAAVYSTPEDLARQAGEWLDEYFRSPHADPQGIPPAYFSVSVNRWVAKSLNLEVPDNEVLRKELMRNDQRLKR